MNPIKQATTLSKQKVYKRQLTKKVVFDLYGIIYLMYLMQGFELHIQLLKACIK